MLIKKMMMDGSGASISSQEGETSDPGAVPAGQTLVEPRGMDVLLGRGKRHIRHPGNRRYQAFIAASSVLYNETWRRSERAQIIGAIIGYVHQMGRFLKRGIEGWYEIPEKEAREKCAQSLRNYRRPRVSKGTAARKSSPQGNQKSPPCGQPLAADDNDSDDPSPIHETSQNPDQLRPHGLLQATSSHESDHLPPLQDIGRDSVAAGQARPTLAGLPNQPNIGHGSSFSHQALAAGSERVNQMQGLHPGLIASDPSSCQVSFKAIAATDHHGSDNAPLPDAPVRTTSHGSALSAFLAETLRAPSPIPLGPNVSFEPARTLPPSEKQGNATAGTYLDLESSAGSNTGHSHPVTVSTSSQTSRGFLASSNGYQPHWMDDCGHAIPHRGQPSARDHDPRCTPESNPSLFQQRGHLAAIQPLDPQDPSSQQRGPGHRAEDGVDGQLVQPLPVGGGVAEEMDNDFISALGFLSQDSYRSGRRRQE